MIQQIIDAELVFGRDREDVLKPELVKIKGQIFAAGAVDFVDSESDGLVQAVEHFSQFAINGGDFRAAIDEEDDVISFFESFGGLAKNFGGDQLMVMGDQASSIDDLEVFAPVFGLAVDSISGDAGFVAHNSSALPCDGVKQSGLSDIRPAHDDQRRHGVTQDQVK
jgi:hypothetical protein